jgi:chorismate mutase
MQQDPKERSDAAEGLDAVRARIDALDDALLDLIEQRLAASAAVAASKSGSDDGTLWLRPSREAAIIARLAGRAGHAPAAMIERIWRELMGASLQAQVRTELAVPADELDRLAPLLRMRFGSAAPLRSVPDTAAALAAAQTGQGVAILPGAGEDEPLPDGLSRFDWIRDEGGEIIAAAVGRIANGEAAQ